MGAQTPLHNRTETFALDGAAATTCLLPLPALSEPNREPGGNRERES